MRSHLFEMQVAWDEEHDKHYLLCDYNRDGDSYRSIVVLTLDLLFGAAGICSFICRVVMVFGLYRICYISFLIRQQGFLILFLVITSRSPWSSKYKPELEDGVQPSPELRNLEQEANEVFSIYRDQ